MDAKQEFTLYWMKLGRKVLLGPDTITQLEECDRLIKEVEDWAAAGKAGLPPGIGDPIVRSPANHESALDGLKCKRCGIEKIYWEHFPDCSRFKPSWDVVRTAFNDEPPPSRVTMTPEEQKQLIEHVEKVKHWMEEHNASPEVRELILRDLWDPEVHPDVAFLKNIRGDRPIIKPKPWRIRNKNPDIP